MAVPNFFSLPLLRAVAFVCCACIVPLSRGSSTVQHSVLYLSEARRNVAMAATVDGLVVAGGCTDAVPGTGAFSCVRPTDAIDIFTSATWGPAATLRLPTPRAWATACALNDGRVVVAGGGTTSTKSATADIVSVANASVVSNASALSSPRWGMACAVAGGSVYFAGGISGQHKDYTTVVDVFNGASDTWQKAPFALSQARESMGALATADTVSFLGGWNALLPDPTVALVDTFNVSSGAQKPQQKSRQPQTLHGRSYWTGGATVAGNVEIAVDNGALNMRNGSNSSSGGDRAWTSFPLPSYLSGPAELPAAKWESGGAIPGEHMPQNGVVAGGCLACFYGAKPNATVGGPGAPAVHCYDTQTNQWLEPLNCTARHKAGGIAAIGSTVFVAGGYDPLDPNNAPTDVVDVFEYVGRDECRGQR